MSIRRTWKIHSRLLNGLKGSFFLTLSMTFFFVLGMGETRDKVDTKNIQLVEDGIRRNIVQCYAIEGSYPPDLAYLKTYYGVQIDEEKYIVHYESFASNIYPNLTVIEKKWRHEYE